VVLVTVVILVSYWSNGSISGVLHRTAYILQATNISSYVNGCATHSANSAVVVRLPFVPNPSFLNHRLSHPGFAVCCTSPSALQAAQPSKAYPFHCSESDAQHCSYRSCLSIFQNTFLDKIEALVKRAIFAYAILVHCNPSPASLL